MVARWITRRVGIVALAIVETIAAGPATSVAGPGSEAPGTQLLVRFDEHAPRTLRAAALRSIRGSTVGRLDAIGVDVIRPGIDAPTAAARLRAAPAVVFAEPDAPVRTGAFAPDDPRFGTQWNLAHANDADIDALEGWGMAYGTDGSGRTLFPEGSGGPVVGIIDTGVDTDHPDLAGKLVACGSAVLGSGAVTEGSCEDDNGHGTHVAGIVSAVTDNGLGVAGVAPDSRLAVCKALGSSATGFTSDVIACLDWLTDRGVDAISMSIAAPPTSSLEDAVDVAWDGGEGTLLLAAAGNLGGATTAYPAGFEAVVSVGATTALGDRSPFSNMNADVELSAPGSNIPSTFPGGYATFSGTSMAAPHAAGVAAMIFSEGPSLSAQEARRILDTGVDDLGLPGRDEEFGFGRVNLAGALSLIDSGEVRGLVRRRPGGILPEDTTVSWSGPGSGSIAVDEPGTFRVAVAPGTYTFIASSAGCSARAHRVTVTPGRTRVRNFVLRC